MSKFWCWLLGHKWFEVSEFAQKYTDINYLFVCSRCGATTGQIIRNGKKE